jgi:CheY-like chemotaxis protein
MTNPKLISQTEWDDQAEGNAPSDELPLPFFSHSYNFTINTQAPSISQTGYLPAIVLSESGDKIETQDAPRSSAEMHVQQASQPKKEPEMLSELPTDSKTPILIVEDTPDIAEIIQATLEGMGLNTVYAGNGKQGLELMKTHKPRVILLDIGLPDITGWRMLDHIKEHYSEVKLDLPSVIIITAYGDPANKLIGKLQNVYSYLVKPVLPDQVERVVNMALKGESPPNPASLL